MISKRSMLDQIETVALIFKFWRNDLTGIDCSDTESHEHRRYIDVLECSAHGVLTSD